MHFVDPHLDKTSAAMSFAMSHPASVFTPSHSSLSYALRRRGVYLIGTAFISLFLLMHLVRPLRLLPSHAHSAELQMGADNSTLGFGEIMVVAAPEYPQGHKWRLDGLQRAATRSGLTYQIPQQPDTYRSDAQAMVQRWGERTTHGFALSWVGHLNAIRAAQNYPTALILEDDVDWDVGIRGHMPVIATVIRDLSEYQKVPQGHNETLDPYGANWDVLWFGHCGDLIPLDKPFQRFNDPLVPPYINSWEKNLAPDPGHGRWVHHSTGPICSFGYALSQRSAKYILEQADHGKDAFDIWLHIRCKGQKLRCFTVNPELFHHHEPAGPIKSLIRWGRRDWLTHSRTQNIWHSARCNQDRNDDDLVTCMGRDEREHRPQDG